MKIGYILLLLASFLSGIAVILLIASCETEREAKAEIQRQLKQIAREVEEEHQKSTPAEMPPLTMEELVSPNPVKKCCPCDIEVHVI